MVKPIASFGTARRQSGATLFIVIFLAAIAAISALVSHLSAISQKAEQLGAAAGAKVEAKNALLGYVRTNGNPGFWGLLPLPDMGKRDASPHVEAESPDNFGADATRGLLANGNNALLIGRLPSKSLGIPALRDNSTNCLWYAVSAAFKASNSGSPNYVPTYNWDTLGDFETGLSENLHDSRAVAIVFGPGIPTSAQSRVPIDASIGESISECGGNYVTGNYLENLTVNPANPTTDSNQGVYLLAAAQASPTTPPDPAITINVNSGTVAGNDQIVAITTSDIFQQIASTGKIQSTIGTLLPLLKSCLEAKDLPNIGLGLINSIPSGQSRYIGPLAPSGTAANQIDCISTITNPNDKELARWRDNLWYLTCKVPLTGCLTLTDTTGIQPPQTCDGLIAFSGSRTGNQRRTNALEKSDPEQYFEIDPAIPNGPDIVNAFRPVTVNSVKARSALSATQEELTQDVALCLQRPSPASNPNVDITKFTDIPPFIVGEPLVNRDPATETLTLVSGTSPGVGTTFSDAVPVLGSVVKANNTELELPSTANGVYTGTLEILSGPGAGQTRTITSYNEGTRTATLDFPWSTLPTAGSVFRIGTFNGNVVAARNPQVTFPAGASSLTNAYIGFAVEITSGPGAGQSRVITEYNGDTHIATVDSAWDPLPDTNSALLVDVGMPPFGKGIRVYFRAKIVTVGDGFVFSLFDADRNLDTNGLPTPLVSGGAGISGQYLGYAGRNIDNFDQLIVQPIKFPKIGLEFDTVRNDSGAADVNDTTNSHIALVYWGRSHDWPTPPVSEYDDDNTHRTPAKTPAQTGYIDPYNASAFGYLPLHDASAINRDFHVRFEIERQYPSAANVGHYVSRLWIVKAVEGMIPGMNNLKQDFTTISSLPPQHTQTVDITDPASGSPGALTEAFRHFRFGFTSAPTQPQKVTIQDLKLRLR